MKIDEDDDPLDDPLICALRALPTPALADERSARVLARARAHLEPAASESAGRLRLTVARALVPGLLAATAVDHVAETIKAVDAVYGQESVAPSARAKPRRT
jgi:hypothetical protein